jgi:hypothetical protein
MQESPQRRILHRPESRACALRLFSCRGILGPNLQLHCVNRSNIANSVERGAATFDDLADASLQAHMRHHRRQQHAREGHLIGERLLAWVFSGPKLKTKTVE